MLKRHKVMTCLTLQAPLAKWLRRRTCNAKITRSNRVRGKHVRSLFVIKLFAYSAIQRDQSIYLSP